VWPGCRGTPHWSASRVLKHAVVGLCSFQSALTDEPGHSVRLSHLAFIGHLCLKPQNPGWSKPSRDLSSRHIQLLMTSSFGRSLMSLVVDQVARMVGSGSHWLDVHGLAQLFSRSMSSLYLVLALSRMPAIFWNFSSVLRELQKGRSGPSCSRSASVKSLPKTHWMGE